MVITLLQHIAYVDCCCWTVKLSQEACMFDNHNINRTKHWGRQRHSMVEFT